MGILWCFVLANGTRVFLYARVQRRAGKRIDAAICHRGWPPARRPEKISESCVQNRWRFWPHNREPHHGAKKTIGVPPCARPLNWAGWIGHAVVWVGITVIQQAPQKQGDAGAHT